MDSSLLTPSDGSFVQRAWERLVQFGLGEAAARIGTVALTTLLMLGVVFVMGRFYVSTRGTSAISRDIDLSVSAPTPTTVVFAPPFLPGMEVASSNAISRDATLHTILPSVSRTELVSYTVQSGDTLFTIAERYGLRPETLLWGNRYTLGDDPHTIFPGQVLTILPIDGTLHRWAAGEGLNGVAAFYRVTPEVIINYPANRLNAATIGDYANPNIATGTLLIVPGGFGEFPDWRTPRISRTNPATATYVGPGACTEAYDGVLGTLNFTWPTINHYLSGYDFSPDANHYGIDLAGHASEPIWAADNGVIVYAGLNDLGYGEMVVIDHGNGWQSLYAHLATVMVTCGQEVYRGDQIGTMGSTGLADGVHLHFEMRSDEFGRVNPFDYLK
ncbi:MAG: peptidoglycan DD-metalloendopeptidase family protein [Anaerolineaceae bacterium]